MHVCSIFMFIDMIYVQCSIYISHWLQQWQSKHRTYRVVITVAADAATIVSITLQLCVFRSQEKMVEAFNKSWLTIPIAKLHSRLLTKRTRFWSQPPAVALQWRRNGVFRLHFNGGEMLKACVPWFRCTFKNSRWSKFQKPCTTVFFVNHIVVLAH